MRHAGLFYFLTVSCTILLASGKLYGPNKLVSGWGLPAWGVPGGGATLAGREVVSWGWPIVLKGPSNPPAPVGQPAPLPQTPAAIACPASCSTTVTETKTDTTTETTTETSTSMTPGILPTDIADASAACVAMYPSAPTPLFNEYAGLQCCVPIKTRDAFGAMVQIC